MQASTSDLIELSDSCVQLSLQLIECFRQERISLVGFKMEEMLHTNLLKEQLLGELRRRREDLREKIKERFGTAEWEEAAALLPEDEKSMWRAARANWLSTWNELRRLCEQNQNFMKHSLRNLECIADNLKRCFGLHSTYSAKGVRVDGKAQGGVLEGSY